MSWTIMSETFTSKCLHLMNNWQLSKTQQILLTWLILFSSSNFIISLKKEGICLRILHKFAKHNTIFLQLYHTTFFKWNDNFKKVIKLACINNRIHFVMGTHLHQWTDHMDLETDSHPQPRVPPWVQG